MKALFKPICKVSDRDLTPKDRILLVLSFHPDFRFKGFTIPSLKDFDNDEIVTVFSTNFLLKSIMLKNSYLGTT